MHGGHFDDECEEVVDERIECLVHERFPWQMSNSFHLVINEQLRCHEQEAKRVDDVDERIDEPRVVGFVRDVKERVDCVANAQRIQNVG